MKATKTDGGYLLNGAKAWCTYANRANVLMVLARTNPDTTLRHKGLSMFFVEKESAEKIVHPNIKGEPIPTVGYHGMRSFNFGVGTLMCKGFAPILNNACSERSIKTFLD